LKRQTVEFTFVEYLTKKYAAQWHDIWPSLLFHDCVFPLTYIHDMARLTAESFCYVRLNSYYIVTRISLIGACRFCWCQLAIIIHLGGTVHPVRCDNVTLTSDLRTVPKLATCDVNINTKCKRK